MRILSFGDIHLNCGYDEDLIGSFRQIINRVNLGDVNLVAITGDIYDRSSDPSSRNIAADLIREMANLVPVIVIRGNHDAPGDLKILSRLSARNPIIVDETPESHVFMDIDYRVRLLSMPWLTKARWQSLHPEASKEDGDKNVSQMVVEYIRNEVSLHPEEKIVLIGHMTVAGAKAQNHQQMGADGVTIGIYDFADSGVYAALLGHIHLKQECGGSRFFYNGSIAALDYGEDPNKYFSVLDTELDTVEWIKLNTVHRQDVNAYWGPVGIVIESEGIPDSLITGARVRINLRVEGGDNVAQAKLQLETWLNSKNVLEYVIRPQVIPVGSVRSIEISKYVGMSEKLVEYWKGIGFQDDATQSEMLIKLEDLQDEVGSS